MTESGLDKQNLVVEYQPLDDLTGYANNARTHSEEQIKQIAESIKAFGWTNPILTDENLTVIAGHGRIAAARLLQMPVVPVIRLEGLSEDTKRALVLADNKLALNAGWNVDLLAFELDSLRDVDFNLDLIGFSASEIAELIGTANVGETGLPDLPEGDKGEFQQMTFILHDEQAEAVKAALEIAKELGPFVDSQNDNSNGNALSRVCELFVTQNGNS